MAKICRTRIETNFINRATSGRRIPDRRGVGALLDACRYISGQLHAEDLGFGPGASCANAGGLPTSRIAITRHQKRFRQMLRMALFRR